MTLLTITNCIIDPILKVKVLPYEPSKCKHNKTRKKKKTIKK